MTAATPDPPRPIADGGRLANNVMQFCRCLRAAGLPIGPGKVLAALEAVSAVGVGSRVDFYWALHAALVNRRDQRELFDQAFHIFWRNPDLLRRMQALLLPQVAVDDPKSRQELSRRIAEALVPERPPGDDPDDTPPKIEFDAALTMSDREVLRQMDFEQMSAEEIEAAKREMARLSLPVRDVPTRRFVADPAGGRIDLRRTLRRSLRTGGATIDLARKQRRLRPPPLVALCDISGSMSRYSRMLLHFLHALTNDRHRLYSFVFATRLTNITRYLRTRDVDDALARVGDAVEDWSGGTRIGACLNEFNRLWSRRVLGQGAVTLLITDGLEREDCAVLSAAVERLAKSSRRLIWLNPLLRYDGYAPKSMGARAIVPYAQELRPVHNIDSLADLVAALSEPQARTDDDIRRWRALADNMETTF